MRVSGLDGRTIDVRRRWIPWRLRVRSIDASDLSLLDIGDGIESLLFGIFLLVFGGIVLTVVIFASEAILLLLLLIPLLALARMLWVLPWIIETSTGDTLLGIERVRGWRDSSDRIREIAEAYQRGEDPYAVRRS